MLAYAPVRRQGPLKTALTTVVSLVGFALVMALASSAPVVCVLIGLLAVLTAAPVVAPYLAVRTATALLRYQERRR